MKKILICILCMFLLVGCNQEESKKVSFKEEYESYNEQYMPISIDESAQVEYLKYNEIETFLTEKTGILYFGFPTCPWCRNMVPILLDIAHSNNLPVYYVNTRELRKASNEIYLKIQTMLSEYLEENEKGEKTLYVPDVYFVKNGKIMGHHLGTVSSQTDPTQSLTEKQKQELKTIYEGWIEKIQ